MSIPPRSRAAVAMPARVIAGLAVGALLIAALLIAARPVSAAKPCWIRVVQDWYDDGVINRTYQRHCYSQALSNVGEDVKVYSSFQEDIRAALQRTSRNNRTLFGRGGSATKSKGAAAARAAAGKKEPRRELFKQAFDKLGPREADSMPLPLLILGGLALLLIAAGAAGLISRRFRARRVQAP